MKLSVSIPDDDVQFIDHYADEHGLDTRSGVVHRALSLLRATELGQDYASAWQEWADADGNLWDAAVADGLEGPR